MELCSIEDAFPKISQTDTSERKGLISEQNISKASREERRAAKKKAKRCKGPALEYVETTESSTLVPDPDRPAVKRLGEIPAFVSYADAFPDISGSYEGFSIPKLTTASCLTNTENLPAYFGKGEDDEEGFANYSGIDGDNPSYQLVPAAIPGFDSKGVEKAGSAFPATAVAIDWKPTTAAKVKTAYFDGAVAAGIDNNSVDLKESVVQHVRPPVPSVLNRESSINHDMRAPLLRQIDELTKRLRDLEQKQPMHNTQSELLMFIGTGIFLLVSFDIALRVTR
jgi:hypothetical protein